MPWINSILYHSIVWLVLRTSPHLHRTPPPPLSFYNHITIHRTQRLRSRMGQVSMLQSHTGGGERGTWSGLGARRQERRSPKGQQNEWKYATSGWGDGRWGDPLESTRDLPYIKKKKHLKLYYFENFIHEYCILISNLISNWLTYQEICSWRNGFSFS